MSGDKLLTVRVGERFLERVKAKAKRQDSTVSQVVRWLLSRWLVGEIPAIPPETETGERV